MLNEADLSNALRRAFNLGQTYWQHADSEYTSQHRKADQTRAKFEALVAETISAHGVPARGLPSDYVNGAGILASDMPAAVVQKLDAAARARGVMGDAEGQQEPCTHPDCNCKTLPNGLPYCEGAARACGVKVLGEGQQ